MLLAPAGANKVSEIVQLCIRHAFVALIQITADILKGATREVREMLHSRQLLPAEVAKLSFAATDAGRTSHVIAAFKTFTWSATLWASLPKIVLAQLLKFHLLVGSSPGCRIVLTSHSRMLCATMRTELVFAIGASHHRRRIGGDNELTVTIRCWTLDQALGRWWLPQSGTTFQETFPAWVIGNHPIHLMCGDFRSAIRHRAA